MNMAFLKCSEAQRVELEAGEWKERLYPGGRATCENGGPCTKEIDVQAHLTRLLAPRAPSHYYCVVTDFSSTTQV